MRAIHCTIWAGLTFTLAACAEQAPTPSEPSALRLAPVLSVQGKTIANAYIVVLKPGTHGLSVAAAVGASPRYVYEHALNGFAAALTDRQLAALRRDPGVDYIEPDQEVHADVTQTNATWGIDRIDQRNLPLSLTYSYNHTGANVRAYVIDTGIFTSHPDFRGRAIDVYDAFGGNGQDCNGHGTHVAGTIGSTTYGVAKQVLLQGVRVLNCNGSGTVSGVIAGVNWVRAHGIHPAVANMSLGGSFSSSENSAVTNLVNSGVFVAVAAGNSSANACNASPASAAGVATVAASDRNDARASFSNYGNCVELYAPGVSITSLWLNGGTRTISGTSMASPHVAGVAVLYKSAFGDPGSSTVLAWIIRSATANHITGNVSGTPNLLLFKASL